MYVCTRVLPSISIDDGVFRHCSLVAFAEGLDYFNGPEWSKMAFARPAVWLHLQKFWIILVQRDVLMALQLFDCLATAFWVA